MKDGPEGEDISITNKYALQVTCGARVKVGFPMTPT